MRDFADPPVTYLRVSCFSILPSVLYNQRSILPLIVDDCTYSIALNALSVNYIYRLLFGIIHITGQGHRNPYMANISVTLPTDGTTADVTDYNTPITTVVNEINGNLDNTNIKTGAAIATSKLADDAGITAAKIAADAVTAEKIDWASTGANGGIWWEELGRTTLGSAGDTITVSSLPSRKYLLVLVDVINSGSINMQLRLNGDSGNNYAYRTSLNGGADGTATSQSEGQLVGSNSDSMTAFIHITNVATKRKMAIGHTVGGVDSAGTAPHRAESQVKWNNTTDSISSVSIVNTSTGDYAIGSEVVVLGHN